MELRFEPFVGRPSDVCKLREPAANLFIEVPRRSTYRRYLSLEVAVPYLLDSTVISFLDGTVATALYKL